jgi:hypothetical protein
VASWRRLLLVAAGDSSEIEGQDQHPGVVSHEPMPRTSPILARAPMSRREPLSPREPHGPARAPQSPTRTVQSPGTYALCVPWVASWARRNITRKDSGSAVRTTRHSRHWPPHCGSEPAERRHRGKGDTPK